MIELWEDFKDMWRIGDFVDKILITAVLITCSIGALSVFAALIASMVSIMSM